MAGQKDGEDAEQQEGKEAAAATGAAVGEVTGDKTLEAMQPDEASGAVNSTTARISSASEDMLWTTR
jgi:hypothetical protein